jgi:hypothetical protein
MSSPTDDELARWRALTDAATPGPWVCDDRQPDDVVIWGPDSVQHPDGHFLANVGTATPAFDCDAANGAFIATAREAMPRLLAELARLRRIAAEALDELDDVLPYKSEHLATKHGNAKALARLRAELGGCDE